MQFTTLALSALSVVGALAQSAPAAPQPSTGANPSGMVTVHVVRVGGMNGSLTFSPENLRAAVGDMVQFQFAPKNHSVVTSAFDTPCSPKGDMFSGYMPVAANEVNTPTYTMMVADDKPVWLYCSQGRHCQSGMVMVINAPATGNRTLAAYKALAAQATSNTAPAGIAPGGSNTTVPGGNTPSGNNGGVGSGTGTGTGSGTNPDGSPALPSGTGAANSPQNTASSAIMVRASATFGLVALAAAFFL